MNSKFDLTKFNILKEYKGNASNKIYLVEPKEGGPRLIYKQIHIYNLQCQLREIQAQKNLKHPYIIRLRDYSVEDQTLKLLIEFAQHGDLFEFINSLKFIKESKLLRLFFKIVIAVEFIHSNGFIHRDIKPENILIGDDFEPKLADFGSSVMQKVVRNTFCGTYEYMAPEIYERRRQTEKVDIWALGILLFEMTHNKMPFKDKSMLEIREIVESHRVPFDQQISSRIRSVVYKILRFRPEERPSAREILCFPELKCFYEELRDMLPKRGRSKSPITNAIVQNLLTNEDLANQQNIEDYKHVKTSNNLDRRTKLTEKERIKQDLLNFGKTFKLPCVERKKENRVSIDLGTEDSMKGQSKTSMNKKGDLSGDKSTFYCEKNSERNVSNTEEQWEFSEMKIIGEKGNPQEVPEKPVPNLEVELKSISQQKTKFGGKTKMGKLRINDYLKKKLNIGKSIQNLKKYNKDYTSTRSIVNKIKTLKNLPNKKHVMKKSKTNRYTSKSPTPCKSTLFRVNTPSIKKKPAMFGSNVFSKLNKNEYELAEISTGISPRKQYKKAFRFDSLSTIKQKNQKTIKNFEFQKTYKILYTGKEAIRSRDYKLKKSNLHKINFLKSKKDFSNKTNALQNQKIKPRNYNALKNNKIPQISRLKKQLQNYQYSSPLNLVSLKSRNSKKLRMKIKNQTPVIGVMKSRKNLKNSEVKNSSSKAWKKEKSKNYSSRYLVVDESFKNPDMFRSGHWAGSKKTEQNGYYFPGKTTKMRSIKKSGLSVEPKSKQWVCVF